MFYNNQVQSIIKFVKQYYMLYYNNQGYITVLLQYFYHCI